MSIYTITLPNGAATTIVADASYIEQHYPDAVLVPEPPPAAQPETRWITKLAFRLRFTKAERIALKLASLDNPAADMSLRLQAASVGDDLDNTQAATYVNLDRADTRAGVETMEAVGLIGKGRAAEILDSPVQPDEAFR